MLGLLEGRGDPPSPQIVDVAALTWRVNVQPLCPRPRVFDASLQHLQDGVKVGDDLAVTHLEGRQQNIAIGGKNFRLTGGKRKISPWQPPWQKVDHLGGTPRRDLPVHLASTYAARRTLRQTTPGTAVRRRRHSPRGLLGQQLRGAHLQHRCEGVDRRHPRIGGRAVNTRARTTRLE